MINYFKKKIGCDNTLHQLSIMPSPIQKIIIEYKDDLDSPKWKIDVYANGENIGYIRRGETYGFWFISKLGKGILEETISKLKISIGEELERYRKFFSRNENLT